MYFIGKKISSDKIFVGEPSFRVFGQLLPDICINISDSTDKKIRRTNIFVGQNFLSDKKS